MVLCHSTGMKPSDLKALVTPKPDYYGDEITSNIKILKLIVLGY